MITFLQKKLTDVGYQKKGYPKQRPKNCLDPKKQEPIEQTRSRPKSPIRPRPPRRGLRGSNESPIRPRPPRRGLRRSTDSPIRARPARHQPRDRRFDQTALAEHHIQSKRSTTPTTARRHSTTKWSTIRQSRQHPAICDGTKQGLPTTVLPNSCTKDNAMWGVRAGSP